MHKASLILVAVVGAWLAPVQARAADVVGIADQWPAMFASQYFRSLDVQVSRLIVSYDAVLEETFEVAAVDVWLAAARASGVQPLIAFNAARGCYVDGVYVRARRCRLPSTKHYQRAFRAFRRRYPDLTVFSPWNEANHHGQPTARRPARAAAFYNVVRRDCRGCTIVAADVLDQDGMAMWLRTFRKHADGSPRLWGLHNYKDVNDFRRSGTRELLRTVPGSVWLTETGGIVRFGHRPFDPSRAARATRFMFKLAASSPRIKRLYIYQWHGQPSTARFDAGLMNPHGRPRPAYGVVARRLGRPGGNPPPAPSPPAPLPEPTPTPTPEPTPTPTPDPICIITPDLCLPPR